MISERKFLEVSAELLDKVEVYYRESKLRKPVWGKITPHVMRYIAHQALRHVLRDIQEEHGLPQHEEQETAEAALPSRPEEKNKDRLSMEDDMTTQGAAELAELEKECEELYQKLTEFWQSAVAGLREKLKEDAVASIRHRILCAKDRAATECNIQPAEQQGRRRPSLLPASSSHPWLSSHDVIDVAGAAVGVGGLEEDNDVSSSSDEEEADVNMGRYLVHRCMQHQQSQQQVLLETQPEPLATSLLPIILQFDRFTQLLMGDTAD